MAAPAISLVICTVAVIALIFTMPFFYSIIVDNIRTDLTKKELKEVADYVSNSLANLYYLVNSTDAQNVALNKTLIYMPSMIENSAYIVKIVGSGNNATSVSAYLKSTSSISSDAWLTPGMKLSAQYSIEGGNWIVVAKCWRSGPNVYAGITYG